MIEDEGMDLSATRQADPTAAAGRRGPVLVAAAVLAALEGLVLLAYAVGIAVAAVQNPDSVSAGPVLVVIYVLFALGVFAVAWALWVRRRAARTPFGVVQLFGLVIGWTLTQGDGDTVHLIGYAVLAAAVVGVALVLSPPLGRDLDR